ncbi:MAG: FixH family protein [Burkholderiales bacterium]|nr:FixH family protein [Burkholderiales bacterium]
MYAKPLKPWYREPWPWLLMVAPAAAVVAGAITIALAVESFDGLVAEDYYKQGLAVNQRLKRAQQAEALGISGTLTVDSVLGGAVRAELRGHSLDAGTLALTLSHPTRAGLDQRATLAAAGEALYVGRIGALAPGRWHVIVEDEAGQWRVRGELQVPQARSATLSWGP